MRPVILFFLLIACFFGCKSRIEGDAPISFFPKDLEAVLESNDYTSDTAYLTPEGQPINYRRTVNDTIVRFIFPTSGDKTAYSKELRFPLDKLDSGLLRKYFTQLDTLFAANETFIRYDAQHRYKFKRVPGYYLLTYNSPSFTKMFDWLESKM